MASIRQANARGSANGATSTRHRYSSDQLFDMPDERVAHYLSALLVLRHEDEITAREILEARDAYDLVSKAEAVAWKMREPRAS